MTMSGRFRSVDQIEKLRSREPRATLTNTSEESFLLIRFLAVGVLDDQDDKMYRVGRQVEEKVL